MSDGASSESRPAEVVLERGAPSWARKYPPLIAVLVALFIALGVLPSALKLPQSNPTETLEYAPIPPDDENPPPPVVGNVSSFGLGSSGSLETEEPVEGDEGDDGDSGDQDELDLQSKTPSTKRCVGSPPRQTDDPNSPPCVANFTGDNFGATYQGVTRNEIKVLYYVQGFIRSVYTCRDPNQITPDGEYFDLDEPPASSEHCIVRVMRTLTRYFNERYQTYDRRVHGYVYFSGSGESPEERRADAADNYSTVRPFAVVSTALHQNNAYVDAMAKKKVLNFGSLLSRPQSIFNAWPKLIWGFYPSIEIQAEQYASYVCTKVKPYPVSFAGVSAPPINKGKPRVYGMWRSGDKRQPELAILADLVKKHLRGCGIEIPKNVDRTFPSAGYIQDNRYTGKQAAEAVAAFKDAGVTTVLWPGGLETTFSKQAGAQGYRPEIVVWGDRIFETDFGAGFQEQSVWAQARMVTNVTYIPRLEDEPCYVAFKEADPAGDTSEIDHQACPIFEDIRQLFIGIQVAGPRLGPTSVDKGFRAIPKRRSSHFAVPACFYEPGDYSCVKDAMAERWDPAAKNGEGCYRVVETGRRYLRGEWPSGDVIAHDKPDDPCNTYSNHNLTNPNGPNPLGED